MSEPRKPSPIVLLDPHHPLPSTGPTSSTNPSHSSCLAREYRKGNWTLQETLVLITAKKLDDERRSHGPTTYSPSNKPTSKTAELRWKWVENYCWKNNCLRSQNQCNDKWDNLLRDYKKVRDYESRSNGQDLPSYWQMQKHERKERNLPSNLLFEIFQALHDVVNRKNPQKLPSLPPPPPPPPPPLPPIANPSASPAPLPGAPQTTDSSTEESEGMDVDPERRRKKMRNLGSSILRGASVLASSFLACEEKKEKRHRDVLELEERKLQMEENRTELNRQGITGLIAAVNNMSSAVHALVSDRRDTRSL